MFNVITSGMVLGVRRCLMIPVMYVSFSQAFLKNKEENTNPLFKEAVEEALELIRGLAEACLHSNHQFSGDHEDFLNLGFGVDDVRRLKETWKIGVRVFSDGDGIRVRVRYHVRKGSGLCDITRLILFNSSDRFTCQQWYNRR